MFLTSDSQEKWGTLVKINKLLETVSEKVKNPLFVVYEWYDAAFITSLVVSVCSGNRNWLDLKINVSSLQILLSFTFPFHYPLECDILRKEGVFNVGLFSTVISTPAAMEQSMVTYSTSMTKSHWMLYFCIDIKELFWMMMCWKSQFYVLHIACGFQFSWRRCSRHSFSPLTIPSMLEMLLLLHTLRSGEVSSGACAYTWWNKVLE